MPGELRHLAHELDIGRVKEGQTAEVRLPTFDQTVLSAKVTQIGAQPQDKGSTEIPVSLTLDSTNNLPLRALLTADVRIQAGMTAPGVSVPLAAVDNRSGEPAVWVVTDDAHPRTVRVVVPWTQEHVPLAARLNALIASTASAPVKRPLARRAAAAMGDSGFGGT